MFENIESNILMIKGAYKKLKSYFYYDRSFLFNRVKLSTWENNPSNMSHCINELSSFLKSLETEEPNLDYLSNLRSRISLIPIPKSFKDIVPEDGVLQNSIPMSCELIKINYYINAPVEILILDTIWALMLSKIAYENGIFTTDMYANKLKKQVFNDNKDLFKGIDFNSNRLFHPYFKKYSSWRNNAFDTVNKLYSRGEDCVLITLDIQSYYYSVVFEFKKIYQILCNDERLLELNCLTKVIENLYITYTAEMQKYRGNIPADCSKGQCAFPIGLISSMVLSNLYLSNFDNSIKQLAPEYYGRYVDDIILVIKNSIEFQTGRDSIIKEYLVDNNILKPEKNTYVLVDSSGGLKLQKEKIRCIFFDHKESEAMIKLLCNEIDLTPSASDYLLPDLDISKKEFYEAAYSIGQNQGTLKVRDFLFAKNSFGASVFLNKLIQVSKNVNINDSEHKEYIRKQLEQIISYYDKQQAIENRSAWINIFNVILINEMYEYFIVFYNQVYKSINSLYSTSIDSIIEGKTSEVLKKVKESLLEQLSIAASIAVAPHQINSVIEIIRDKLGENDYLYNELIEIESNSLDIRKSNLFNHHLVYYPLINYSKGNEGHSLINNNNHFIRRHNNEVLDMFKLEFTPRFIHIDEIFLWEFLDRFQEGGNISQGRLESIKNSFEELNSISINYFENTLSETIVQRNSKLVQKITINDSSLDTNKDIKIALASILIDEKKDVQPVLTDDRYNLTPNKKSELFKMLNESLEKKSKIIVFPEFFLPIQWLQEVLTFSRKNSIAIISGLRYVVNDNRAYNYLAVLQPFKKDLFKYSIPLLREKNYYAPEEKIELAKKQKVCKDVDKKTTQIINWNGLAYSELMCYELTDIEFRNIICGLVHLLVIPELNKDTNYFSNMVEATTRDIHAYLVQVNTSKYGDSRITGPFSTFFKDIIKLKGGKDNIILTGSINIEELKNKRKTYIDILAKSIDDAMNGKLEEKEQVKKSMKDPVAGFSVEEL